MSENKPSYYAIITADVRYSKIPPNAKLLFGEITALCNKEGYCWASNKYFSELYNVEVETVSRWISVLEENEFIRTEIIKSSGNERRIFIRGVLTKKSIGINKNINTPLDEKVNTSYNNTSNNTTITTRGKVDILFDSVPIPDKLSSIRKFNSSWKEWIGYRIMLHLNTTSIILEKELQYLCTQKNPVETIDFSIRSSYKKLCDPNKKWDNYEKPKEASSVKKNSDGVNPNRFTGGDMWK